MSYDAIVIGAGVNGLAAAAALGKAGRRVLLVEQADATGGTTRSLEFAPGFRAAPLAMDAGWLPPSVARVLNLRGSARRNTAAPLTLTVAPREFLTLPADPARAGEAIRRYSEQDGAKWPDFTTRLHRLAGFLERLYQRPAPDIHATAPGELLSLADLAFRFRRLGRRDMTALLRTLPMAVQELLDEWFACEPLKAAVAAGGVQNVRQGPRSGGTAFVLLHHLVGTAVGAVRRAGRGPAGAAGVCAALEQAARAHGVTIRTGAAVRRIAVEDDAVAGVVVADGEEITAPIVLSSADPARTLLGMVDPVWLDPEFLNAVRNIKYRGCTALVLYALDSLVEPPGLADPTEALAGVVSLTPTLEALERAYDAAKYGRVSQRPHVEVTVPTLRSVRQAPEGKHVLVARVQYAPYRLCDGAAWDGARRDVLADAVTAAIGCAAPGFADRVLHRVTLVPPDLEARFGLTEGAVSHGELTLDQVLFMRPVPGWGRYATPIAGLYLCGAGTHPGPGVLGGAGLLAAKQVLRDGAPRAGQLTTTR